MSIKRYVIPFAECKDILKLIGDYWVLMITVELLEDELRFCQLQRALDDINPIALTNRLKKMEEAKLITKTSQSIDKQSVVYAITEDGKRMLPFLQAMHTFVSDYLQEPENKSSTNRRQSSKKR